MNNQQYQHSFANPAPGALVGLSMACFTFYAMFTGKVTADAAPVLACWMFGGGLLQYIAGLMELKNGDMKGGNVFFVFGAFFMFSTSISLMTKYLLTQHGFPFDPRVEGWAWLSVTIPLILWTPAYLKKNTKLLFIMMCLVDIAILQISLMDMKVLDRAVFGPVVGWILLSVAMLGIYLSSALIINDTFGKTVVPIPGPVLKEDTRKFAA